MGWRERDYAKFRKDEFEAIYGSTSRASYTTASVRATAPSRIGRTTGRRRGSAAFRALRLLAVAVAATATVLGVAIAMGNVTDLNALGGRSSGPAVEPALVPRVRLPVRTAVPVPHGATRIAGTRLLQTGTLLTLSDSHTPMPGTIVVSGRWGEEGWETFAVARGERRTFSFRIPLTRRGTLRLRIAYPDGGRAVGTYQVR